jgi:pre-rRNA-processing protein RIX1
MAPQLRSMHPLRMITQRLQSTPAEQLPYIATYLTDALLDCGQLLSTPADQIKKGTDDATTLHKFKTQLSTLLQSKSASERWTAVLLVKATVEAGGIEVVQGAGAWVRSLLGYLNVCTPGIILTTNTYPLLAT